MDFDTIFSPRFPMLVNSDLATLVGLDESIFVQQLHYWQLRYGSDTKHNHDGKVWIYNSAAEWRGQFPFWSEDKIGRLCRDLERREIIFSTSELNAHRYDRTKWYTLNLKKIREIVTNNAEVADITHSAKLQNGNFKNEEISLRDCKMQTPKKQNLYQRLPEITKKQQHTREICAAASLPAASKIITPELEAKIQTLTLAVQIDARTVCIEEAVADEIKISNVRLLAKRLADPNTSIPNPGGWLREALRGDYAASLRVEEAETAKYAQIKVAEQKRVGEEYAADQERLTVEAKEWMQSQEAEEFLKTLNA